MQIIFCPCRESSAFLLNCFDTDINLPATYNLILQSATNYIILQSTLNL